MGYCDLSFISSGLTFRTEQTVNRIGHYHGLMLFRVMAPRRATWHQNSSLFMRWINSEWFLVGSMGIIYLLVNPWFLESNFRGPDSFFHLTYFSTWSKKRCSPSRTPAFALDPRIQNLFVSRARELIAPFTQYENCVDAQRPEKAARVLQRKIEFRSSPST